MSEETSPPSIYIFELGWGQTNQPRVLVVDVKFPTIKRAFTLKDGDIQGQIENLKALIVDYPAQRIYVHEKNVPAEFINQLHEHGIQTVEYEDIVFDVHNFYSPMMLLHRPERTVLDHLTEAVDAFMKLPIQHPMHQQEFASRVHDLQRMVMSRPTARMEGWVKAEEESKRISINNSFVDTSEWSPEQLKDYFNLLIQQAKNMKNGK